MPFCSICKNKLKKVKGTIKATRFIKEKKVYVFANLYYCSICKVYYLGDFKRQRKAKLKVRK